MNADERRWEGTASERTVEERELLRDIEIAERQLGEGQGVPHERARQQILEALGGTARGG